MASHLCAVPAPDLLIGCLTQAELLFLMVPSAAPPLSASHTMICESNESFPATHMSSWSCPPLSVVLLPILAKIKCFVFESFLVSQFHELILASCGIKLYIKIIFKSFIDEWGICLRLICTSGLLFS